MPRSTVADMNALRRHLIDLLALLAIGAVLLFAPAASPAATDAQPILLGWAWLIPLITAAFSAYGANRAAKQAGKRSSTERELEDQMLEDTRYSSAYGRRMLDRSEGPLTSSQNFWQSVLSGNRESLGALYSGEIADLGTQSRTAYQTASELAPRSGISAEYLSSMPFNRAIAERRITSSAKPDAANALSTIGTNLASIGSSAVNSGRGGAAQLLGYGQDRRAYAGQVGSDTGAALFSVLKMLGDAYTNRNKDTAGGTGGRSWWSAGTGAGTSNPYRSTGSASTNYW